MRTYRLIALGAAFAATVAAGSSASATTPSTTPGTTAGTTASAGTAGAAAEPDASNPIVIGAAMDATGSMAPVDGPPLAAARPHR